MFILRYPRLQRNITISYLVSLSRLDSSCICDAKSALREKQTNKKTLLNIDRQNPPQTSRCEFKLAIIKPKPLKINYPGRTKRIFKSWKISTDKSPYISLNNWLREFASSNDFQKSHIYFSWLRTEIFGAKLMLDTFGTKRLNAPLKPQECLRANKSTVVK